MRVVVTALSLVVLAGCTTPNDVRIAVLQNPETKQTVECKADGSKLFPQKQIENCTNAYEKAGYKLVSDSADFGN